MAGLNIPPLYAALVAVLGLVLAGTAGYFIGRYQSVTSGSTTAAATQTAAAPAQDQLPAGVTRLPTRTFGSWNLGCLQNQQNQKKCELVLRAVERTRKALVLSLIVARNAKNEPMIVVVTPPSVALGEGVRIQPAGSPELKAPFARCLPGSCQASIELSGPLVDTLNTGDTITVSYVAATGRAVQYKLPLTGFREGYAAWLGG